MKLPSRRQSRHNPIPGPYAVSDGLLEATTIFAVAARQAGTELVVNNSQLQGARKAPSFRNMQHGLADRFFDWAEVGAVHLHAPPYYENVRALVRKSVADLAALQLRPESASGPVWAPGNHRHPPSWDC